MNKPYYYIKRNPDVKGNFVPKRDFFGGHKMLYFASDYMQSGHEAIFRRFLETSGEHLTAYGSDQYCQSAAEKIRSACACPEAEVRFLTGGTQTNQVAIDMAEKLKAGLREKGYTLYMDSPTNQQFIAADDALLARLSGQVAYGFWEKLPEGRTVIRFATSRGTQPEEIDALLAFL